MEKVRVLQIVTYMGRGGLETMLMNYFRSIDRNKVQFDFLVHRNFEAAYDKEIQKLGGRIYHIPPLNPFSRKYHSALDKFFSEHKYHIVHSHLDCMSAYPLSHAKKAGIPVRIAHAHSKSQDKNVKYPLKILSKTFIPQYATHLFAFGKEAGEWMFNGKDFQILRNAIDSRRYSYSDTVRQEIRKEFQIQDKFVIGHVGRFSPPKNHEFIVEIFNNLQKKRPNSILFLVGDGKERGKIEEKVKLMNISDKVIFAGVRSDINRLLQGMDMFFFPSLYEGLGIAVIEAQASGLPCVISTEVPEEVMITDLVQRLPLTESFDKWVDALFKADNFSHRNGYTAAIKREGYDINDNARLLENFYLKVSEVR